MKMKKQKENLFSTKFRLLNSQEHSEEIRWSTSESSEFEDIDNKPNLTNITNKKANRKRKRKTKAHGNVSNLDIAIIDVDKEFRRDKSPVLSSKTKFTSTRSVRNLTSSSESMTRIAASPVLCVPQSRPNSSIISPVIPQKFASPVNSPKVKKSLFIDNVDVKDIKLERSISPVLSKYFGLDRRKKRTTNSEDGIVISTTESETQNSIEFQENEVHTESKKIMPKRNKIDLINKVKSFFDSHFNSENSSQHSIAETLTPKNDSNSNDDIEILSTITQLNSNENSVTSIKYTNSTDNSEIEAEKTKNIKYKKDGLAYRLNVLLKKHKANISLWQHERFLAENSSFKIPKGEHLVFRIQKVNFKFGCFCLEAVNVDEEVFLILINNSYVNSCVFHVDDVLKIYEPYQIIDLENHNSIVNVCKFECIKLELL